MTENDNPWKLFIFFLGLKKSMSMSKDVNLRMQFMALEGKGIGNHMINIILSKKAKSP